MSLKAKLDAIKAGSAKKFDPAIPDATGRATRELELSGILDGGSKAGGRAPLFCLKDAGGKEVASESLLARGPLLVTLYRGAW